MKLEIVCSKTGNTYVLSRETGKPTGLGAPGGRLRSYDGLVDCAAYLVLEKTQPHVDDNNVGVGCKSCPLISDCRFVES